MAQNINAAIGNMKMDPGRGALSGGNQPERMTHKQNVAGLKGKRVKDPFYKFLISSRVKNKRKGVNPNSPVKLDKYSTKSVSTGGKK